MGCASMSRKWILTEEIYLAFNYRLFVSVNLAHFSNLWKSCHYVIEPGRCNLWGSSLILADDVQRVDENPPLDIQPNLNSRIVS